MTNLPSPDQLEAGQYQSAPAPPPTFKLPHEFRQTAIKVDNTDSLVGQYSYEDWADTMKMVFRDMGTSSIVINWLTPAENASTKEKDAYLTLSQSALLIMMQVVSKPILKKVLKYETPHAIWKYLHDTYYVDNAFSYIQQWNKFTTMSHNFKPSKPIHEFLDSYETEWELLYQQTASGPANGYRPALRTFLSFDKAKRHFLLGALVKYYPNLVDNLSTKDNLTYAELKSRLHSLAANQQLATAADTALITSKSPASKKRKQGTNPNAKNTTRSGKPDTKWCTYCKKHNKTPFEGHTWTECRRLKRDQEAKKQQATQEAAHITMEHAHTSVSSSSPTTWKFDSGTSSHMSCDIGQFNTIKSFYRTVTIGGNTFLQVEGTGTVRLHCLLPDGSVQPVILKDVLYVPTLCHNLFSWNSVRAQGYIWEATGNYGYIYTKKRILVLTTDFHNGLACIIEAPKSASNALVTYNTLFEEWHNALGHPSQIVPAAY